MLPWACWENGAARRACRGCHQPRIFKTHNSCEAQWGQAQPNLVATLTPRTGTLEGDSGDSGDSGVTVRFVLWHSARRFPVCFCLSRALARNVMVRGTVHLCLQRLVSLFLFCLFVHSLLPLNVFEHCNNEVGCNHCCRASRPGCLWLRI